MIPYQPMVPGITVYGQTIGVFFDVLKSFAVLQQAMLEVLEVREVDPEHWYPQELVLRAYQKVDFLLGGRGLERFGRQVPPLVVFPPGIADAHAVLEKLDVTFHLNHRRDGVAMFDLATGEMTEGIGHYRYERVGEREGLMCSDNPYPCRFDMGLIHGFVARFATDVVVTHEPGECRSKNGSHCLYRARW